MFFNVFVYLVLLCLSLESKLTMGATMLSDAGPIVGMQESRGMVLARPAHGTAGDRALGTGKHDPVIVRFRS